MTTPWQRFKQASTLGEPEQVPVALIADSPWLPGLHGIDTLEYFLLPDRWFAIQMDLRARFPDVVWVPDFWVEYGMAAEPSALGARIHWRLDSPPSIEPVVTSLDYWAEAPIPDVYEAGFMPLILRMYRHYEERLQAEGLGVKVVAARGPMVTAGWIMGITDLMMGVVMAPAKVEKLLDNITTMIIRWLQAQLDVISDPQGIMLLDDIVGMVSLKHYEQFAEPYLRRIFDEFDGLIRIYHNDTPCEHLYARLADANFDVFNFTHKSNIADVKAKMGHRVALMGNVDPLNIGVRGTPEETYEAAIACLDKAAPGGGLILSVGGGISPGMPAENVDALVRAARDWNKSRHGPHA